MLAQQAPRVAAGLHTPRLGVLLHLLLLLLLAGTLTWHLLCNCCCCLHQVGLLYIHDPQFSPQQHADLAKKLCANFGGKLEIGVLKVGTL
jgi:hypothetical protein